MNCLEFRRLTLVDPETQDSGYRRHRRDCAACRDYAAVSTDFEADLREAMTIAVPDDLVPRVLLAQAIAVEKAPRRPWFGSRAFPGLALAASLLLLVAAGWLGMRDGGSPPLSLSAEVVAHIEAERDYLTKTGEVGEARLAALLEGFGARVRHGGLGRVSYAGACEIRNRKGVHLVLQGERGPVTVLYLPGEAPGVIERFEQDGFSGELLPVGRGSLAVVGEQGEALEAIITNLEQAIAWGP
jgi:hypothetical protein